MRVPRAAAHAAGAGAIHYGIGLDEQSSAALTIALDAMQAYAVLITLGFTVVLIFFLAFCVCSKKEDSYSDCYDYEGIHTVRMSHHIHDGHIGTDQTSQASSRCTMKRELPAIPDSDVTGNKSQSSTTGSSGPSRPIGGVQVLPSATGGPLTSKGGSNNSGHSPRPSSDAHLVSNSSTVSSDLTARQTSHSSFGSGPSKEHQYAHLKRTKEEHPYAKVGGDPETDTDNYDDPKSVTMDLKKKNEVKQKSHYETVTETTKKTTQSSIGESAALYPPSLVSSQNQKKSPSFEIQASSAITGSIPANEEMPYMTPKTQVPSSSTVSPPARSPGLSQLGEGFAAATSPSSETREDHQVNAEENQQQHFSGDSQDSRGYSSFSVREPLSALRGVGSQPSSIPPHMQQEGYYMTVSDDSADETYACIYDRTTTAVHTTSGVSTESNQQTYAQIQKPITSSSSVPLPSSSPPPAERSISSPSPLPDPTSCDPPAPPSVDSLKHVLHSRQASAGSTSGVISSPNSEKRGGSVSGTRCSPLPPLPQGTDQMYYEAGSPGPPPPSATSPPQSGPGSPMKTSMSRSSEQAPQMALEDMYAKVMKKRDSRTMMDEMLDATTAPALDSPPHSGGLKSTNKSSSQSTTWSIVGVVGGPPPVSKPPPPSDPGYETVQNDYPTYETLKNGKEDSEPGYETVTGGKEDISSEPGYETVKGGNESSEPGYETVSSSHRYEADPGYESVQSRRPQSECDSNYEQLKFTTQQPDPGYESVIENNYEKIKEYGTEKQSDSYPMYAEIKKSPVKEMPVYASVQKKTSTEPLPSLLDFDPLESSVAPPPVVMSDFDHQSNGHEKGYSETDDEGLDSPSPNKSKYKRSLEEEAALLVSSVEETAISILSSRKGSSSDKPEIVSMITKEEAMAKTEDLLSLGDLPAVNAGSEGSSDTSSDAVFSRKITYDQPKTLPGLISTSQEMADDYVENGSEEGSILLKKDSGSVETESAATRDTNKASIEVQNGSHHTSVDNSSSGREDISPEDEVCLPPHEMTDDTEEEPPPPPMSDMEDNAGEEEQSADREGSPAPHTPTVLSIPVPQQSFYQVDETSEIAPPPPLEDDLPEQDQQLLPSPPPVAPNLNMEETETSQFDGVPPPPSDMLSDAPECDLPPLPPLDILPPMSDDPLPPPMIPNANEGAMNVTINPMAEIDELSSIVKKSCEEDLSPVSPQK